MIDDVQGFETNLELLLQSRIAAGGVYREDADEAQNPFGVSIAYLGLLFAVLASGCQSSDLGSKERELTSQVYGEYLTTASSSSQVSNCILANLPSSLLFLPVSSHDKLSVSANNRSNSNTAGHWKCAILQHEPRYLIRLVGNDSSDGAGPRTTRRVK